MIKYKRIIHNIFNLNKGSIKWSIAAKRWILSSAYDCHEDWNNRLNFPILSNIRTLEFMTKLREKHDIENQIDAIDIDILANKLEDLEPHQLDFAEELFYSFRHTDNSVNVIDSTPHALLRNLMIRGEDERISRILQDKVHYGIFLDTFSANLLLNYFIKKNDIAKAVQIVYDLMLQEDLGNELTEALILYVSFLRMLELPLNAEPRVLPNQTEMEVKFKKVAYIQPLWYDDHFDLFNEHAKLGRTMEMLVMNPNLDAIFKGLEFIGLGLSLKFGEAIQKIENIFNGDSLIAIELLEHFEKMLLDLKTTEKTPEIEPGLLRLVHLYPYVTAEEKNIYVQKFQELKPKLTVNKLSNIDVLDEIKKRLNMTIEQCQSRDIQNLKKLYQDWIVQREELVKKQIHDHYVSTTKKNLAERLIELTRTEEKLRFFEESSIEIALDVARKRKEKEVDLKMKEEEEVFVLPPGERKLAADAIKKKKK